MARIDPRMDLNLYRVLSAIYAQGGISEAARALHLSQPAISHALRRLRTHLDDPLFVRQGNQMMPTERCRRIIKDVQRHLQGLQEIALANSTFHPEQLETTFRIGIRDILETITFPRLMRELSQQAPRVAMESLRVPREHMERALLRGQVDMAIERKTRVSHQLRAIKLADEPLVVVSRRTKTPRSRLSLKTYQEAMHVLVTQAEGGTDPLQFVLAGLGLHREIVLRSQHYFSAAQVIAQSDWLLTMPRTYAWGLAKILPLTVSRLPFDLPPIEIMLYWAAHTEHDPAQHWLRQLVIHGHHEVMHQMNNQK